MRKSPTIKNRFCELCGAEYTPTGNSQRYCTSCRALKRRESNEKYREKRGIVPHRKICDQRCSACSEMANVSFEGKPYCNKHYQRLLHHGTTEKMERQSTNTFVQIGDTLKITTAKGEIILADCGDIDLLKRHSWCISKTGYAVANISGRTIKMHRLLLGDKCRDRLVDHKNGDPRDNRRSNLRVCDASENARNVKASKNNPTGVSGVSIDSNGKYRSRITVAGKEVRLGTFDTLAEASDARRAAEAEYYGEFAPSNRNSQETA